MLLNDADYTARIERIKSIRTTLAPDPLLLGYVYFLQKTAELQTYKDLVLDLLIEASRNKLEAKVNLEDSSKELDMQISSLLATDETVKNQKTAELRNSMASVKSADLEMNKHHTTLGYVKADSYYSIVNQVYLNIEKAVENLAQQLDIYKIVEESGALQTYQSNLIEVPKP